jgi:hypothetical protein
MLEKFRELSRESKIVLIVLSLVGFIFVVSLAANYFSEEEQQVTEEPTEAQPTPNIEPSTPSQEEPLPTEDAFPQEDSEGNLFLEDGIYSEEFGEEEYYSDDAFYYEAVEFLNKICIQNKGETFETKFNKASVGEKYMTSQKQYEKLFFNEIFATNCKPLTGAIFEENAEESFQSVTFNVYLESDLPALNGIRQITYNLKLIKESDGYHVIEAEMVNHELYE